ncbi:MAG: glycosyltransferase family 2 protein [Treponema sp.]|nr:glycosyltransferase family 2 protein [Treponema sp.]
MIKNSKDNPLVSVCVISYNSSDTIIETLDSIKKQDYKDIELIVSDDCSTDNTRQVIEEWMDQNSSFFKDSQVIFSEKNKGVTHNCNQACRVANGEIIKLIGADDILLPTYLSDCVDFFNRNPQERVLFLKVRAFLGNDIEKKADLVERYDFLSLSAKQQFDWIKRHNLPLLPTASAIYRRSVLEEMDFFDERIPMWEDGPFYFKLAQNLIHLAFLDKEGVLYRVRESSLSNGKNINHMKSEVLYYRYYSLKYELLYNSPKAFYHLWKIIFYSLKYGTK